MIVGHLGSCSSLVQLILPVALLITSCTGDGHEGDKVVARAYEEKLLWSDLRNVIPMNVSPQDSVALARQFIQNWTERRAVLHQAEQNLSEEDKDFQAQLQDYRNSLVIYAYEQALVQQKLDTVILSSEMEEYHRQNLANFQLREPIMRVRWAKVREGDKKLLRKLEDQFLSGDHEQIHQLEIWLAQRGVAIVENVSLWRTGQELAVSLSLSDPERFKLPGRSGKSVHEDGDALILLEILELRNAGDAAPLEFVSADIRSILINQRKLRLLQKMRNDLYLEAIEEQQIEIY